MTSTTNWFKHIRTNYSLFDLVFFGIYLVVLAAYYEYIPSGFWQNPLSTTPPLLIVTPIMVLFAYRLLQKKKSTLHLIIWGITSLFIFMISGNGSTKSLNNAEALSVCSWNTAYFFQARKDQKDMRDQGFRILKDTDCDILMLQEVWNAPDNIGPIISYAKQYFPAHDIHVGHEFVILTPQATAISIDQSSTRAFLGATINIKGKSLHLVNVHLWNPLVDRPYKEGDVIKYRNAITERSQQTADLSAYLVDKTKGDIPLVVMGDFNTLPTQKLIRSIQAIGERENKLSLVGTPFWQNRATYPAHTRIMQIDFAYVSRQLQPHAEKKLYCYPEVTDHCLLFLEVLL